MALINCPECRKEISTNAKICPHCGCEITVCPDCNAVFKKKPEVCPACGHIFTQPVNQDTEQLNFIKGKLKILNFAIMAIRLLKCVGFLLIIITFIKFFIFIDTCQQMQLNEFISTKNSLYVLTISAIVIYTLAIILSPMTYYAYPTYRSPAYIILKIILNVNNLDGIQCCKDYLTTANKPVLRDYKLLLFATFLQKNKTEENLYYVRVVLAAVLTIVSSVCCGIFFINYMDSLIYCLFWDTENNYITTFSSYIPLIIVGVAFVGTCIIDFNKTFTNVQKWCKDNSLPYDFNIK